MFRQNTGFLPVLLAVKTLSITRLSLDELYGRGNQRVAGNSGFIQKRRMDAFAWPISICTSGLLAFGLVVWRFPKALENLFARFQKAGPVVLSPTLPDGPQQQQLAPKSDSVTADVVSELLHSAVVREWMRVIRQSFDEKCGTDDRKKIELLIHELAVSRLSLRFAHVARYIYGSQVELLVYLNTRPDGVKKEELRGFYDAAVARSNGYLQNTSFEQYLEFIESQWLVSREGDQYQLSEFGREFLVFLVQSGDTVPRHY